jgi:hypothetical protein
MRELGATQRFDAVEKVSRLRQLLWAMVGLTFAAFAVALFNIKHFYRGGDWRPLSLEVLKLVVLAIVVRWVWVERNDYPGAIIKVGILTGLISLLTDLAFMQLLLPH